MDKLQNTQHTSTQAHSYQEKLFMHSVSQQLEQSSFLKWRLFWLWWYIAHCHSHKEWGGTGDKTFNTLSFLQAWCWISLAVNLPIFDGPSVSGRMMHNKHHGYVPLLDCAKVREGNNLLLNGFSEIGHSIWRDLNRKTGSLVFILLFPS